MASATNILRRIFHALPGFIKGPIQAVRIRLARIYQSVFETPQTVEAFNTLMHHATGAPPGPGAMCAVLDDTTLPHVDISAVTYNSAKWIESFTATLLALDYPKAKMHVHFVDNASTDTTPEMLRHAVRQLALAGIDTHLSEQDNLGFGAGHNTGLGKGSSPFGLVTNLDLTFEPDALRRIVSHAMSDQPLAAAWEMRQKPYEHPKIYEPLTGTTHWNAHACVLIRREAFEKVGGYSPDLFMYGEDVELSYRLRAYGFVLRYNPHAVVYHYSYEHAAEVKPAQFSGSTFANLYIRLRYGTLRDIALIPLLALYLLVSRQRYPGARLHSLRNIGKLFVKLPAALAFNRAHKNAARFPFSAWDYDLVRKGPFHEGVPLPDAPPKVTVITRSYKGRAALLQQAMASVANQTYPNIEHLITEDRGETLAPLVAQYASNVPYNVAHITGNKIGRSDAGNLALAQARGTYCVFLDDDDQFYCDHIETLVAAVLAAPEARAAYSLAFDLPCERRSETGTDFVLAAPVSHAFMDAPLDAEEMKVRNFLSIQAVLFERSLYSERGGFDEDLEMLEDWALWQKYLHRVTFAFVPKTTSFYRTPLHPSVTVLRMNTLNANYDTIRRRMDAWRKEWDTNNEKLPIKS